MAYPKLLVRRSCMWPEFLKTILIIQSTYSMQALMLRFYITSRGAYSEELGGLVYGFRFQELWVFWFRVWGSSEYGMPL